MRDVIWDSEDPIFHFCCQFFSGGWMNLLMFIKGYSNHISSFFRIDYNLKLFSKSIPWITIFRNWKKNLKIEKLFTVSGSFLHLQSEFFNNMMVLWFKKIFCFQRCSMRVDVKLLNCLCSFRKLHEKNHNYDKLIVSICDCHWFEALGTDHAPTRIALLPL